jgi:large subunit ribosomal protein L7/L12
MTVLELSELIKEMEEKFGVSAAAAAVAVAAPAAGGGAAAAEEKTEFTVNLTNAGAKKVNVIKVVRAVPRAWASRKPRIWLMARRSPSRKVCRRPMRKQSPRSRSTEAGGTAEIK